MRDKRRSERRYKTERVIEKKMNRIPTAYKRWLEGSGDEHLAAIRKGRLRKGSIHREKAPYRKRGTAPNIDDYDE